MFLELDKFRKLIDNDDFLLIAEKFAPINYGMMQEEERLKALQEMEDFLAKFEGREAYEVAFSSEKSSYVQRSKNKIFIHEKQSNAALKTLGSIIHEGAHIFIYQEKGNDKFFNSEEREVLELNTYVSKYNKYFSSYLKYTGDGFVKFEDYQRQPQEYFADKITYLLGREITSFLENKGYKDLVEKFEEAFLDRVEYPTEWYNQEVYNNEVLPIHFDLTRDFGLLKQEENMLYESHREKDEKIVNLIKSNDFLLDDNKVLISCFFPTIWNQLNENEKLLVTNKFLKSIGSSVVANSSYSHEGLRLISSLFNRELNNYVNENSNQNFKHESPLKGLSMLNHYFYENTDFVKGYKQYKDKNYLLFEYPNFENMKEMYFFTKEAKIVFNRYIKPMKLVLKNWENIFGKKACQKCDSYFDFRDFIDKYEKYLLAANKIKKENKKL